MMLRKIVVTLALSGIVLATGACNTVKGMGRDIQSVGQVSEDAMKGK